MARKCIVCGIGEPAVPDRNVMGRPIKKVCRSCHAARLRGDLEYIMKVQKEKNANNSRTS